MILSGLQPSPHSFGNHFRMMFADAQTPAESAAEGGFQTTDGAVRLLEDGMFQGQAAPSFESGTGPMLDSSAMQSFNSASVGPDGITFSSPTGPGALADALRVAPDGSLTQLATGGFESLGSTINSMLGMPGATGLLVSLFQFLGSLFGALAQAVAQTASEIARNYAVAAQSAMDLAKMMRSG